MGKNEEQINFKCKINYLNLIKTETTDRLSIEDFAYPIAAKIWLQFMRIEEYWLDFFLSGRSAFKGKIRSNPTKSRNQSHSDCFAIESKRGDHNELKILLKNRLIASRFNQKLREEDKIHQFLKKNSRDEYEPSISRCDLRCLIVRNCRNRGPRRGPCSPLTRAIR